MLVDTHCHLAGTAFEEDLDAVLGRAWAAGVAGIVVMGELRGDADRALRLAEGEPRMRAALGVHPHHADRWNAETAAELAERCASAAVVAVGETGLDYHYEYSPRAAQHEAFHAQLTLAEQLGKPAVIHAREADDDVAAILREHPGVTAILHSFASGTALAAAALAMGHYLSFSGMITFKNWQGADAVAMAPADRLLVETDGPYLAPVPRRGKRNEPAFVAYVAARLAELRGVSTETMLHQAGANTRRVFRWPALSQVP